MKILKTLYSIIIIFCLSCLCSAQSDSLNVHNNFDELAEFFQDAFNEQDFERALRISEELIQHYPNKPYSHLTLIFLFENQSDFEKIFEYSEFALASFDADTLDTHDRFSYYSVMGMRGISSIFLSKFQEALNCFTLYFKEGYMESYFLFMRSIAYLELGYIEEAYTDILITESLEPYNVSYIAQKGNVLAKKGQLEDAIFYLKKAEDMDRNNAIYTYFMADAYFENLDYDSAILYFDAYLNHPVQESKADYSIYLTKIKIIESHFKLENYKECAAFSKKFIEENREESGVGIYYFFIESHMFLEKFEDVLLKAQEGSDIFITEGYFDLAIVRAYIGLERNFEESTYHLNEALQKSTITFNDAEHYEFIAKTAFSALGNLDIARAALNKGLENGTEKLKFTELKLNLLASTPLNPRVICFESIKQNIEEIKQLSNELIAQLINDRTKMAYYLAVRAISSYLSGDFEAAFKDIKMAISMHDYYEYYAIKAIVMHAKLKASKSELTADDEKNILDELNYGIESSSEQKRGELFYVKAMLYLLFGDKKQACQCANNAKKSGADLSKALIKQICNKKYTTESVELGYALTIYYDR